MNKILVITIFSLLLSACSVPFIGRKQAALQVNASPNSTVYLNDNDVGATPYYDDKLAPGQYSVKIQVQDNPNLTWQTNVTLAPHIITVVNRQFGTSEEESSNYLLQLEPLSSKDGQELSVITIPDNVIVKVDGQPQGFSPVAINNIAEGDHTILLSAPGYQDLTIKAQMKKGYKLILSAQLARSQPLGQQQVNTATDSATLQDNLATPSSDLTTPTPTTTKPTPTPAAKSASGSADLQTPYVEILETGTGWLRVRSAPDANADNEVAKVDVGDKFPYIKANDTGWYQIEYAPGKEGWISGRYAKLYE